MYPNIQDPHQQPQATINIQISQSMPGQPYAQPQSVYNQPQYQQSQYGQPQPQMQSQYGYAQPQPGYGQPQAGYPQLQPVYVQGGPAYVAPQDVIVMQNTQLRRGYERLLERDGIFIKQKMETLEMFTGCETENTYYVYPLSKTGDKKGHKLFKCKEKSGCVQRQCLSGECRAFDLNIKLADQNDNLDGEPFLHIERPCRCTFYCCNRPEITVHCVQDGKNEYVGKIVDKFNCCDITLVIFDKNEQEKYHVTASCCQIGLHCKGPLDCCQRILFELKTPSGDVVANIEKKSPGCIAAMVTDMDNFAVHFPKNCSKEDRALIMSSVLFLDFRYFEENKEQQ